MASGLYAEHAVFSKQPFPKALKLWYSQSAVHIPGATGCLCPNKMPAMQKGNVMSSGQAESCQDGPTL